VIFGQPTATLGVTRLEVYCDSLLVVSQVSEVYVTKDNQMVAYLQIILSLKSKFPRYSFKQVPRQKITMLIL